jgi:hypothetical protein
MSGGPIKQWRDGHKVEPVSSSKAARVCLLDHAARRSKCGRRAVKASVILEQVTCPDCRAAVAADNQTIEGAR